MELNEMKQQYLKAEVQKEKAVQHIQEHLQNWLSKWLGGSKKLNTIELVYLPYFIFPYRLESKSLKDGIRGYIGIESYEKHSVILPVEQETFELDPNLTILPAGEEIDASFAYDVMYNEAFIKEKHRTRGTIRLQVDEPFLLYVPYWIGYLKGTKTEIMAVDGLSGNIDFKMKDPILKAFLKEAGGVKA